MGTSSARAGGAAGGSRGRMPVADQPRLRGEKPTCGRANSGEGRTSPACAGRKSFISSNSAPVPDQPRSRGESAGIGGNVVLWAGPAPLARGELAIEGGSVESRRTSSARAGRTCPPLAVATCSTDQPRSRGDDAMKVRKTGGVYGPAPLARGERRTGVTDLDAVGTSPARAGRTWLIYARAEPHRDQPRSRGEKSSAVPDGVALDGPAPLARGEQLGGGLADRVLGTSPLCAGRTRRLAGRRCRRWDQPRSRGRTCSRLPTPRQ